VLILPSKKEIVHSLKDVSLNTHTAEFMAEMMLDVIDKVGHEKFSSIVSDNASTMICVKKKVQEKYPSIMPIRCITYHINLLMVDIMKHNHAKETIRNCMKIVNFFKRSYQCGALLSEELKENLVKGGGLKGYTKTRWSTAFDCLASIKRCENTLHNVR